MEKVLVINQLSKNYGKIKAVSNLSFAVERGQVFGILGPNGSGKTTTLAMLVGIIKPVSGNFKWFDKNISTDTLKRLGTVLETPNFYPYLSAGNNLRVVCKIKDADEKRIDDVLSIVNLLDRKKSAFKTFSYGMKQRLAIASALLNNPEVLILDEPTNGLDPQGIADVRELILRIAAAGTTILLASHLLAEVEKVCSHVAVLRKGTALYCGAVDALRPSMTSVEVSADDLKQLESIAKQLPSVSSATKEGEVIILNFSDKTDAAFVNRYLFEKGITVKHLAVRKQNLEQQFLELISAKE